MRTGKICSLLLLMMMGICTGLTGCSQQSADITYEAGASDFGYTARLETTFSENLCVVPLEAEDDSDAAMKAESSLIFDVTDNAVLYQDNVYERLYPASITKLMTAYVTFKYANLEDIVTFSHDASHITEPGAQLCGFKEGDQVKLRNLLCALLLYSGNDAGIAIAEHVAGNVEAFADLMNQEAKALGATGSHFVNPHGLSDENHYTTTYDIYLILNALIKNEDFIEMIKSKEVLVPYKDKSGKEVSVTFKTTNRFVNGDAIPPEQVTVIGGKTGTTLAAGHCLALYSQGENGHDYISIVFKADSTASLYAQMTKLLAMIP